MSPKTLGRILDITNNLKDLPDGKNRHFSFIVHRNSIVSMGFNNSYKTHPLAKICDYRFNSIHSELSALIKLRLKKDNLSILRNCSLVNTRINRFGDFGISKPCENCLKWVSIIGFKDIYYTNNSGKFEKLYETDRTVASFDILPFVI